MPRRTARSACAACVAGLAWLIAGCAPTPPCAQQPPWQATLSGGERTATAPEVPGNLPEIVIDRDDIVIDRSCRLRFVLPVADANGDGVVHINTASVIVDLGGGMLAGCTDGTAPDAMTGTGIRVTAPHVVVMNGSVRGYKVAIHASDCDFAQFRSLNLSGNWAPRLLSTPQKENEKDWLWPHVNDGGEWRNNYGAALCVERAREVRIANVRACGGQNGIILDRVNGAQIVDCDCSYLSGWGLAMWRSNQNLVCRNAFDFCVRGYSHGVYNRGQDSAGILCFEQCTGNVFASNSATHCGDGFFGFAGNESLAALPRGTGDAVAANSPPPGCDDNLLVGNDFSFAAAHGMEMTFSKGNLFCENSVEGAAICGLWGGYSSLGAIDGNHFIACGDRGSGNERGGINIEHGQSIQITGNVFERCAIGIRLWWDEDPQLVNSPWGKCHSTASELHTIASNSFRTLPVGVEIERSANIAIYGNEFLACGKDVAADAISTVRTDAPLAADSKPAVSKWSGALSRLPGAATPIGARRALGGRESISMQSYGPEQRPVPASSAK